MEDFFLTYEQCLVIKGLGFREHCLKWYLNDVLIQDFRILEKLEVDFQITRCPLKSQFFKWVREKYKIHIEFNREEDKWKFEIYEFSQGNKHIPNNSFNSFVTYEEAENESINYILKQLK
jgi:hypothetical protein